MRFGASAMVKDGKSSGRMGGLPEGSRGRPIATVEGMYRLLDREASKRKGHATAGDLRAYLVGCGLTEREAGTVVTGWYQRNKSDT